jgi:hypothetical protein
MDVKAKSFFLKTAYYRSFWFIIAGIIGFIVCMNSLTKKIDDYPKVVGVIKHTQLRWNDAPFDIELEGKKWFSIYYRKIFPVLQEKAVKGKQVMIWHNKKNNIEQLMVEGEIIYPYTKANWLWIVLMTFSLFLSVGNVIYIIKYPSDAEGKESISEIGSDNKENSN